MNNTSCLFHSINDKRVRGIHVIYRQLLTSLVLCVYHSPNEANPDSHVPFVYITIYSFVIIVTHVIVITCLNKVQLFTHNPCFSFKVGSCIFLKNPVYMTINVSPSIVSNSKILMSFGNPLKKQTFTIADVHPAVMGS